MSGGVSFSEPGRVAPELGYRFGKCLILFKFALYRIMYYRFVIGYSPMKWRQDARDMYMRGAGAISSGTYPTEVTLVERGEQGPFNLHKRVVLEWDICPKPDTRGRDIAKFNCLSSRNSSTTKLRSVHQKKDLRDILTHII
jgi:hypothetical protein